MTSSAPHLSILVIEDNIEHLQTIASAFQAGDRPLDVTTVNNCAAALDFLHGQEHSPAADLILLNLDLTEQQGYYFLQIIKTDPRLRRIPIIALSATVQPDNILKTYTMQGNCHIIKARDAEQLTQTIQKIEAFWLGVVTLPLA